MKLYSVAWVCSCITGATIIALSIIVTGGADQTEIVNKVGRVQDQDDDLTVCDIVLEIYRE